MASDAPSPFPTYPCPRCGKPMEAGYLIGSVNRIGWTRPKMGKDGPHYSEWQDQYPLVTPTGKWSHLAHEHPLSYRCTSCWIYWLAPTSEPATGAEEAPLPDPDAFGPR
jgi:hypothetical protein